MKHILFADSCQLESDLEMSEYTVSCTSSNACSLLSSNVNFKNNKQIRTPIPAV